MQKMRLHRSKSGEGLLAGSCEGGNERSDDLTFRHRSSSI